MLDNLRQAVIIITLQIVINYDLLASSKNSNGMMYRVWSASRIKELDKATVSDSRVLHSFDYTFKPT